MSPSHCIRLSCWCFIERNTSIAKRNAQALGKHSDSKFAERVSIRPYSRILSVQLLIEQGDRMPWSDADVVGSLARTSQSTWNRRKLVRHFRLVSVSSARTQVRLYSSLLILRGRGDSLGYTSCMGISARPPSQKGVTSAESVW